MALFSYIKHAGIVAPEEKKALRARVHQAADVPAYLALYAEVVDASGRWETATADDHSDKIQEITGAGAATSTVATPTTATAGEKTEETAVATRPPTTVEILEDTAGSKRAVSLAKQLPSMTFASVGIPGDVAQLLSTVTGNADSDSVLRRMVEAMLLRWKTYDGAIEAGTAVLGEADDNST
jgi:hypothetical protein